MSPRPRRARRGSALVLSLLSMSAFTLLAGIVHYGARAQVRGATYAMRQAQALTIAEAGLEDAMRYLYLNAAWNTGIPAKAFAGGYYVVSVTTDSPPNIISTGYSAYSFPTGRAVRTVTAGTVYTPGPCPYALMADRKIRIEGKVDAYDPLVTLTPSATEFIAAAGLWSNTAVEVAGAACPPAHIRGSVYAPSLPAAACVDGGIYTATSTVALPSFTCPTCSGTNQLTINAGDTVTITSGTYYYTKMTIKGTFNLDTSSGAIHIYLSGNFSTDTGCQINNTSKVPSKVRFTDISVGAGHTVKLECATPFHAYMEGNNSQFDIAQEVYGHFCGSQVTVSSATGAIGQVHFDVGGGVLTHVALKPGTWRESYERQ